MKIITIGRSSSNDVVINDDNVTRGGHCQIRKDDYGNYWLLDLNSTNGTFVNGVQRHGEIRINQSDIVRIGNSTLPWQSYFGASTTIDTIPPGYPYPGTGTAPTPVPMPPRERHGFITFWFILGIIGSIISPIIATIHYQQVVSMVNSYRYQSGYDQISDQMNSLLSTVFTNTIVGFFSGIFGIICIILLFNWKKIGFYGMILGSILFGGVSLYLTTRIANLYGIDASLSIAITIITIILSTFIFYAILQIKKNGVKFWDNLE